jgi:hypothetical protein
VYRHLVQCAIEQAKPAAPEPTIRPRLCRGFGCGVLFYVCSHCDRGQSYCSHACREQARRQQRQAANRRYQRTAEGKEAHRLRQRAYRHRRAPSRVTDQGLRSVTTPDIASTPNGTACSVCGCQSRWMDPFSPLQPWRRYRSWRRRSAAVQKTTFSRDR